MRAGPRRNTGRSLNSYLYLSRTCAVVWQILAVNPPQFGVLGAGEPDHSGAAKPSKSLTASRATVGARWAYRIVITIEACPINSCTTRIGTPRITRCEANV